MRWIETKDLEYVVVLIQGISLLRALDICTEGWCLFISRSRKPNYFIVQRFSLFTLWKKRADRTRSG